MILVEMPDRQSAKECYPIEPPAVVRDLVEPEAPFGPIAPATPQTITDDSLRLLYTYWRSKCRGRRMPSRADIDPTEMGFILGWMNLIDVLHDPFRFRFRLQGTMLAASSGVEMTGRFLEEHPHPDHRAFLRRIWELTVERREPTLLRHERKITNRSRIYESLRLPLSSDGDAIDMLMVAARHQGMRAGTSGLYAIGDS